MGKKKFKDPEWSDSSSDGERVAKKSPMKAGKESRKTPTQRDEDESKGDRAGSDGSTSEGL
jgi:hypothetical protein